MNRVGDAVMPRARDAHLVVETLADETLVYDLERHRAHCLNRAATLVWRACDGHSRVAATAALLERELGSPHGLSLLGIALEELSRARLLDEPGARRGPRERYSRRAVIRALGLAGAASLMLPVVESIVAPIPAEAASCLTTAECAALAPPACTGQPICGSTTDCCVQRGQNCRARVC
jgi:hypothetical protein